MVGDEGNWVGLPVGGIFYFQIARKLIEVGLEEASRVVKQIGRLTFRHRLIKDMLISKKRINSAN